MAGQIPHHQNGDITPFLQQLLQQSTNRDSAIERIATSVRDLTTETGRKLDEAERDTRKQFDHFATNIANQFQNVTNKFEAALATRDAKLEAVSAEFLKSRQAPWMQLIALGGLLITFGGAIGWMAYKPVLDRVDKVELAITEMANNQTSMREFIINNFVTQKDLDARSERGREDRERTNRALEKLQESVFSKDVHKEKWDNFSTQIEANSNKIDASVLNLQREIDVLQKSIGDTYTARDVIMESRNRISELERLIRELMSSKSYQPGIMR